MTDAIVEIEEGQLRGAIRKDFLGGPYYEFLGIPFAEAPVGELRFKAPVPIGPWKGIRDATKQGPACPSRHMVFLYRIGAEDNCLNLNVYTKNLPNQSEQLKPVMVWIYGGAFVCGSNHKEMYNPDYLITEDIVFVAINYRTGPLGFLSFHDPSLDVPGNAGLKDMVLALKWVQRNIRHFCGDPNNVTIFGQSAGGASVQYLLLSPSTKGLFHKAIAQSGSCFNIWTKGCTNGTAIAKKLGFPETDEKKILQYLQTVSASALIESLLNIPETFEPWVVRPFGPIVEKKWSKSPFLTEDPLTTIQSGGFHQVPMVMGYASSDGMFFEASKQLTRWIRRAPNFEREVFYDLNLKAGSKESEEVAVRIKRFYFGDKEPSSETTENSYLMRTDNMFFYGVHRSVSLQKMVSTTPIYFYKFTMDTPGNVFKVVCISKCVYILVLLYFLVYVVGEGIIKKMLLRLARLLPRKEIRGTCHGDDLALLFRTFLNPDLKPNSEDEIYVRRFIRMWANFARTGNPTPDEDDPLLNVKWDPVTRSENVLLNIGSQLKMEVDPDQDRANFLSDIINEFKGM